MVKLLSGEMPFTNDDVSSFDNKVCVCLVSLPYHI